MATADPHRPLSQAGHAACACCGAGERRAIAGCFAGGAAGVLLARRALSPTERAHEVSRASPPLHYTYAGHGHSIVARTKPTPADTWGPRTERAHVSSASVLRQTRCHPSHTRCLLHPRPAPPPHHALCRKGFSSTPLFNPRRTVIGEVRPGEERNPVPPTTRNNKNPSPPRLHSPQP
ncbi:hypothetical protein BDA96_01G159600 [Sorghum bicolor]|uniref:Uncharacterized protein n=2 Tax=Sorghum bicolor TaxID=4558 RepID=A0A921RXH9_SORBI|nr:hypothetical protein BDA96_01G159600 [Sorghum bicolor]KXG37928.2 hypothetical protein SORBI_3001G152150 [Sorghum bicolor]